MAENNVKIILEAVNQTKQAFSEVESQGTKVANNLKAGWLAFAAAGAAILGVIKSLQAFVSEAAEAEEIQNRLRYALETTGYTWQHAKGAVDDFANSIQKMTRYSDEEARQALTDMLMYTRDFSKAQDGARLAMDMSIRTGQDLGSTTRYVGMAMNGSVEVLARFIPELRDLSDKLGANATAAEKAEYAMKILNEKFGGTAQRDVDSYTGRVKQFENAWSDLKEVIGNEFLPVLKDVFEWLTKVVNKFVELTNPNQMQALQKELETIDKLIGLRLKGQIAPTTDIWSQAIQEQISGDEELLLLELQREEVLEKIRALALTDRESRRRLAGETGKDGLPSGEGGKADPFLVLYGMTEAEFKDRMSYSKLMHEEWKEFYLDTKIIRDEWKGFIDEDQTVQEFVTYMNSAGVVVTESLKTFQEQIQTMRKEWTGFIDEDQTVQAFVSTPSGTLTKEEADKMTNQWTGVANQIGSAFQSGFFDLFKKGFDDIGDVAQQFFENLAESALRALTQIGMNLALFGNVKGDASSGGGLVGLLGSLFSSFMPAASGASFWTRGPTPMLVGEGGESEFVSVTPKSKMGQGGGRRVDLYVHLDAGLLAETIPSSEDIKMIVVKDIYDGGMIKKSIESR